MNIIRCLKCDFLRLFHNYRFIKYQLFITIFTFILFVTNDVIDAKLPVLYYVSYETSMHIYLLVYPISFLVFGPCLMEDREEHYFRQVFQRTGFFPYILSKSIVNMFTSVISVMLSVFFSSLLLGIFKGWEVNIDSVAFLVNTDLGSLFETDHFMLCDLFIGLQLGMLSGLVSSIAFFVASVVNEKIFAAIMTFTGCMVIQYIWGIIDKKGLVFLGYFIVSSNNNHYGDHWMIKCFCMMIFSFMLSLLLSWIVIKRRIQYE